MENSFNFSLPSINHLRRNISEIRDVQLRPCYLRDYVGGAQKTEFFGHTYDAPFGVAPMGLQGLMWPRATEILADTPTFGCCLCTGDRSEVRLPEAELHVWGGCDG